MLRTVLLLILSNLFMTYAWYGHLKTLSHKPIWIAVLVSWGVAFFEYCFQVPANRIGLGYFTLPQLKIIQEVITMVVFSAFAVFFMKEQLNRNFIYASVCMVGAVYFIFRK
ncbi:MAG TPA: DMT family protein [Bacteriovoracaceae bacterium]|nr:DMT family protein [Bacteriovoracaceae bacterium]